MYNFEFRFGVDFLPNISAVVVFTVYLASQPFVSKSSKCTIIICEQNNTTTAEVNSQRCAPFTFNTRFLIGNIFPGEPIQPITDTYLPNAPSAECMANKRWAVDRMPAAACLLSPNQYSVW